MNFAKAVSRLGFFRAVMLYNDELPESFWEQFTHADIIMALKDREDSYRPSPWDTLNSTALERVHKFLDHQFDATSSTGEIVHLAYAAYRWRYRALIRAALVKLTASTGTFREWASVLDLQEFLRQQSSDFRPVNPEIRLHAINCMMERANELRELRCLMGLTMRGSPAIRRVEPIELPKMRPEQLALRRQIAEKITPLTSSTSDLRQLMQSLPNDVPEQEACAKRLTAIALAYDPGTSREKYEVFCEIWRWNPTSLLLVELLDSMRARADQATAAAKPCTRSAETSSGHAGGCSTDIAFHEWGYVYLAARLSTESPLKQAAEDNMMRFAYHHDSARFLCNFAPFNEEAYQFGQRLSQKVGAPGWARIGAERPRRKNGKQRKSE